MITTDCDKTLIALSYGYAKIFDELLKHFDTSTRKAILNNFKYYVSKVDIEDSTKLHNLANETLDLFEKHIKQQH